MLRPLPVSIGLRYLRVRRRSRFVSVVALVAVLGVALGVAALIVVLSVMNGMQDTLTGRILDVTPQVTVSAPAGSALAQPAALADRIGKMGNVRAVAPFADSEVVLGRAGAVAGARLRGIDPAAEARVSGIGRRMIEGSLGSLSRRPWGIVLGRGLALSLNVIPGDKVTVVLPRGLVTPVGFVPRSRRFTVVGIFYAGSGQYDSGLALVSLADAQRLLGLGGPNGLALRLRHPLAAATVAAKLRAMLPSGMRTGTWQEAHHSLFAALANEERMMFVLVALAVLIAAFNILGVLTVLVADKRAEIAVLASMGLTPRGILAVFLSLGGAIGAIGIGLGLAGGLAVAFNVNAIVVALGRLAGHPLFAAGAVSLAGLPARVDPAQVATIVGVAAVLVVAAAWVPARRAARLRPVEALAHD